MPWQCRYEASKKKSELKLNYYHLLLHAKTMKIHHPYNHQNTKPYKNASQPLVA
ncbi:hypothetical protein M2401_004145 [Pseudomonas sp. JUb42]|nr:hypothetical protein [Pseudomonas sp. JUb42]